jgi:hypothetical protein
MQKPLAQHHIRSKPFSLPVSKLHSMHNSCLESHVTILISNEYKLTAVVLDIALHILVKPVGTDKDEIDKLTFLKFSLANEGLD